MSTPGYILTLRCRDTIGSAAAVASWRAEHRVMLNGHRTVVFR